MRHRYRGTLFLSTIICIASSLGAQSTAQEDSALWKADSADLIIQQRDKGAPKYSKDAQRRQWVRDSIHGNKRIVPPGPVATTVDIHGSGSSINVGQTMQLFAEVKDANGAIIPGAIVTWSAGPLAVADISATGLLTGKGAGTTTTTAKSGSVQGTRSFTVIGVPPVPPDTTTPPVPPDTTTPPVAGFDGPAELPKATVDITMPTGYNVVVVGAQAGAMQAAIDAAGCRTELRGAPNFDYGLITLRQKPCNEKYHTIIRTNNGLPLLARGIRQTPGTCQQRQCTRIVSKDAFGTAAVTADRFVHGYYFEDLAILGAGTTPLNAIVRLGVNQTTLAEVPGDFVFSHVLNSGTPTLALKRNYYTNSSNTAVVDGSCMEGHDNNGDSQCFLGLNGPGPYLIENNYMEASHEVIMFGGGDPSIQNLVPSNVTIRRNHITRPTSWKGVWSVKNLLECKNVENLLVEYNVFENNWADAQVGYFFLCKSVNQDNTAPWSRSKNVVFRYNLARNVGAGVNLCATCQNVVVPMSQVSIHDNIILGVNTGIFTGEAREWQFLGGLTKVNVDHNTTTASNVDGTSISFDGQPPKMTEVNFRDNIFDFGQYGYHGTGTVGVNAITTAVDTSTSKWTYNLSIGPECQSAPWMFQKCATSTMQVGIDARGVLSPTSTFALPSHDGKPLGADVAKTYAMTAGVVVSDPLRPQIRRPATARQSGYRSTGCLNVKVSDPAYATKCATSIQNTLAGPSVK